MIKEKFIIKAQKIHKDKYDYSLINYKNNKTKVKIICPIHGIFEQRPGDHLKGHGCITCGGKLKLNNNSFIEKAKKVHGDRYDYSLVSYINNRVKVKIICKEHGVFEQLPLNHLKGMKCFNCFKNKKLTTEQFIEKAKQVHGDRYDYSLVNYINSKTKVKIICRDHGVFEQSPNNHISNLNKNGCPKCRLSKAEILIEKYLKEKDINFTSQYSFKDCKGLKNLLPYDFYLPDYNICIEYDGEQHFRPIKHFGGFERFKQTILTDEIKNQYCKNNNIKLIRIKDIKTIDNIINSIKNLEKVYEKN